MSDAKEKIIEIERNAVGNQVAESIHQFGNTKIKAKSTFGSHDSISDLLYHTVLKKLQDT